MDVNDIVHIEFTGLVKPREYVFGHEIRKILVGPEIIMLDIQEKGDLTNNTDNTWRSQFAGRF